MFRIHTSEKAPGLMSPFMTPHTTEIFRPMTCQYLEMNRQHVFIENRNYLEALGKNQNIGNCAKASRMSRNNNPYT
uniref:Uncharacterized protein n=1 Tax=Glossina brevipalpis TaxID=37001 RepID=A0A1A9WVC0_9MUSC